MSRKRLPHWLKRAIPEGGKKHSVQSVLHDNLLPTVCEEAKCPNRAGCFGQGTATFLLMGDRCTRSCRFCSVTSAEPEALPTGEPEALCKAVGDMGLQYVVLTSVTRDDVSDGGAGHIKKCVEVVKEVHPTVKVEVLVPDFQGSGESLEAVLNSPIDVFNHNVEMPQRLYATLRPKADYRQSLNILSQVKCKDTVPVKTGFMVGLGETNEEVYELLRHIAETGTDIVTIGQYLQPSKEQVPVDRFVTPDEFDAYKKYGESIGIGHVEAGPFVRSSYEAAKIVEKL